MSTDNNLFSREAEEAVIGSVLINPVSFTTLGLEPNHFFIQRHGMIWQAFNRLYSSGIAFDFVTLSDELERAGQLHEVGGQAFLTGLINATPSSLHVEDYARTVKDFSHRRIWKRVAEKIAKLAFDKDSDLELEASGLVDELLRAVRVDGAAVHIAEYALRVLEEATQRKEDPKDIWGIPSGFIDFDDITGGLQLGEALYISGKPGIGKSIMAMQMGFQMAAKDYPGAIYSIEMKGEQVVRRRVSADSKISTRTIKTGKMDDRQFAEFLKVVETYEGLPLYLSDAADMTTAIIRADLSRLKIQHGIQWFVLDYAYLLRDGEGLSETDRTGLISSYMKAICRSLNLAGVIIHSLNKEGMQGVPEGKNIRGSGQQFYDTDLLLFLVEDDKNPNIVKCIFGKGRELEQPKQSFKLHKLEGFPALANAAKGEDAREQWQKRKDMA
jgi:replicative DNA helicase